MNSQIAPKYVRLRALAGLVVLIVTAPVVLAQNYSISWWTVAGGGGASTGGVFSLCGTMGQPAAGTAMTNGSYSITGGFWALPVAVQSGEAPALTILPASPGQATISWAPNTPGFVLQSSPGLDSPAWANAPSGATNPVVVPANVPTRYYRLVKP
ncbi:MAG TPA: hypothetical protein VJA21_20915 [Verrucomicrobiae bacterium]